MKPSIKVIYTSLLFTTCVLNAANAQSKIHGLIVDVNGKPVPQANVLLLHLKDSALVKGMVTTASGSWSFDNTPAGSYIITSTFIGFKKVYSSPFKINNLINNLKFRKKHDCPE